MPRRGPGKSKKPKPNRQGMRNMPPGAGQFIGNQYVTNNNNPLSVKVSQGSEKSITPFFQGNLEGASIMVNDFSKSFAITNASGKTMECLELMDLNTAIGQLFAAEDNKIPYFDKVVVQFDIWSTQKFVFMPAICLIEDGENFTTTELESVDPIQGIKDVLDANSANYRLAYGKDIQPSGIYDNASIRWMVRRVSWDITRICNDFAKYKSRADLAEDTNLELRLVGACITDDNGSLVTCSGYTKFAYHEQERPLSSREYP